ncbi:MAG: glycosyl hydrolase family 18 protein [Treponema sp.]|nr:glycosyl hydrolase family 18 protein [Treponema sp.]
MKQIICLFMLILTMFNSCSSASKITASDEKDQNLDDSLIVFVHEHGKVLPVSTFKEVWGYVIAGQEAALKSGMPLTDVCHFGAEVDVYGKLTAVPKRQNLPAFSGKAHLTVTCASQALTYFTLLPGSPQRSALISDLIAATAGYDGLNIDFENIPPRSGEAFLSFLKELKAGLPKEKIFSIALYGRTRQLANDVYDYEKIKPLADRIFIMAYDEHWSGSKPGPVSSLRWCRSVAEYSMRVIGAEKLVMGIPFYGRAWESQNHSRALVYSTTEKLLETHRIKDISYENGIPTFDYKPDVTVKVYFEDEYSISARMELYKSMNIKAVGFWRIGQETSKVWDIIKIE